MTSTLSNVFKAIKLAHSDSKGPPVMVFTAGGLKSGKTTFVNRLKKMCTDISLKVVIVEQSQYCNKTYDEFKHSLEPGWRVKTSIAVTKLTNDINATTIELDKSSNKLKEATADTEKYEELSQVQINLNTRLVALKNSLAELNSTTPTNVEYVYDVILLDRTQIYKSHRNTVTEIYTSIFKKPYPENKCIGVNMITSLETCISRVPKNRNYESVVKFMTNLYEGFKCDHMTVDQGYAYVFDIDGFTPNTTELKTVTASQTPIRRTTKSGGGGGAGGGSATNPWKSRETNVTPEPVPQDVPVTRDDTPFDPVDLAPETASNTESAKMEGFVLALDNVQRTGLIATLKNLKGQGILGMDALKHPVMYCNLISCRRTTQTLTANSFKNVPLPGTKVKVTFDAYVFDNKLGCLTGYVSDTINFVAGRTFLPIDLTVGNNGNASRMLEMKSGTRYAIDPITIEMTVGIFIRNPDLTTDTVYDVRDIAVNMFEVLSGTP